MTYIVGMKRHGVTSLIADLRATVGDGPESFGVNSALKSGILFPGAIYAASGSFWGIRAFVHEARRRSELCADVADKWASFLALVNDFPFFEFDQEPFALLIASRASGQSILYQLVSSDPSLTQCEDFQSFGSGKQHLDHYYQIVDTTLTEHLPVGRGHNDCPPEIAPAYYCLGLTEAATGFEIARLESIGVGGVFYYLYQNADGDFYQPVTLFLICHSKHTGDEIALVETRIGFVDGVLAVSAPRPSVVLAKAHPAQDPISWLATSRYIDADLISAGAHRLATELSEPLPRAEADEVWARFESMPLYDFCGVGFAGRLHRGVRLGHHRGSRDAPFMYLRNPTILPKAWTQVILDRCGKRPHFPPEFGTCQYCYSTNLVQLFRKELGYREQRLAETAQFPDQSLPLDPEGLGVYFRLKWYPDSTAVLMACELRGHDALHLKVGIKIDFALVLSTKLPAGEIGKDTRLESVIEKFAESFGYPVTAHPDHPPSYVYRGPWNGAKPEVPMGTLLLAFRDPNAPSSIAMMFCMDENKYFDWYRECVFDTLPTEARANGEFSSEIPPINFDNDWDFPETDAMA